MYFDYELELPEHDCFYDCDEFCDCPDNPHAEKTVKEPHKEPIKESLKQVKPKKLKTEIKCNLIDHIKENAEFIKEHSGLIQMVCHCSKEYNAKKSDLLRGWALSCSKRCAYRRKTGSEYGIQRHGFIKALKEV